MLGERLRDDASTHGIGRFHAFQCKDRRRNIEIGSRRVDHRLTLEIRTPQYQRRVDHERVQPPMTASTCDIVLHVGGRDSLQAGEAECIAIRSPLVGHDDIRAARRSALIDQLQRERSGHPSEITAKPALDDSSLRLLRGSEDEIHAVSFLKLRNESADQFGIVVFRVQQRRRSVICGDDVRRFAGRLDSAG